MNIEHVFRLFSDYECVHFQGFWCHDDVIVIETICFYVDLINGQKGTVLAILFDFTLDLAQIIARPQSQKKKQNQIFVTLA